MFPISFGSDNHSRIHPRVFLALQKANLSCCPAYISTNQTRKVAFHVKSAYQGAKELVRKRVDSGYCPS